MCMESVPRSVRKKTIESRILSKNHDPLQRLEIIREHLAQGDRPIGFLFGAGTSMCVPDPNGDPLIPGIEAITDICAEKLSDESATYRAAWDQIIAECVAEDERPHLENVLTRVERKRDALHGTDRLAGLTKTDFDKVVLLIRRVVAGLVQPNLEELNDRLPHEDFAVWVSHASRDIPVEIFTLNYDLLLEHALESLRIPIFDGFVGSNNPFFYPDGMQQQDAVPGKSWLRLWKLHGSINWALRTISGEQRVVRREPTADGEMIYPSQLK